MTEELQTFATELVQTLTSMAPDALALATQIVQITAIQQLVSGIVCAIVAVILFPHVVRATKSAFDISHDNVSDIFLCIFGSIGLVVTIGFSIDYLLDVWVWVGVFNPELRLARETLMKLIGRS